MMISIPSQSRLPVVSPSGKKTSVGPQCERTTPKRSQFMWHGEASPPTSARDTEPLRFGFVGPSSCHRPNEQEMHTPASKPICFVVLDTHPQESIRAVWCDGWRNGPPAGQVRHNILLFCWQPASSDRPLFNQSIRPSINNC
jgi:hypothetical protein